jgi:transcriptional regulator with XRE-family HTH domain
LRPTGEWLNQPGGLAERLLRLRKASGLTGDRLAERLGWPRSKVVKLENGRQMPKEADLTAWAQATGQPEAARELLDMLSEAETVHRQWKLRLRSGLAALQEEFAALERAGKRIRNFEVVFIPGLLQTEDYARYRIVEAQRRYGIQDADAALAAKMARQGVLYAPGKTFEFVITEAALRFLLCPPEVMAGQLDRLLIETTRSSITLGIIPFGVQLADAPVAGFETVDDLTVIELPSGHDSVTARESADYDEAFDLLMAEAVTGEEARRLIAAAVDDLRRHAG